MSDRLSLGERLKLHGISRRALLKFCAGTASMMALPPGMVSAVARETMGFWGGSNWRIYTPSTLNLQYAIGYAMRFSPALLSPNIDPHEYAECINMQANYRVAPHGGIKLSG